MPFGCFGKFMEGFRRFSESFDVNRKFLKKSENLTFWLRGPDLGKKAEPFAQNCGS